MICVMRNSQSDDPASPSLDAIEDFVLGFAVLGFRATSASSRYRALPTSVFRRSQAICPQPFIKRGLIQIAASFFRLLNIGIGCDPIIPNILHSENRALYTIEQSARKEPVIHLCSGCAFVRNEQGRCTGNSKSTNRDCLLRLIFE